MWRDNRRQSRGGVGVRLSDGAWGCRLLARTGTVATSS